MYEYANMDINSHESVSGNLTCCLLMILTYKDSVREEERYLKRGLFFFYFSVAFGWACVIVYMWSPRLFVYLNSLCYCSFIMMSVTFYHVAFWWTLPSVFPCDITGYP